MSSYEGKKATDKWYPVILLDSTDFTTPEPGKPFGDITAKYYYEAGTSLLTSTVLTADWKEAGEGGYSLRIGNPEFANAGKYEVMVACSGCVTYRFTVEVKSFIHEDHYSGHTVVEKFKQLHLKNDDGDCFLIDTDSGNGNGIKILADAGAGIHIDADYGFRLLGGGAAILADGGNYGIILRGTEAGALVGGKTGSDGDGLRLNAQGTGKDLVANEIGVPADLGDGASLADMLTALAGAGFVKSTDSQEAISDGVAGVKAKTDNLPADPASETNVDAEAAVLAAEHAALSGEHTALGAQNVSILADTGPILADTADMQPKIGTPTVDLATDINTKLEDADARDLLFNRDVVTRHANQKPSQYTAGTGGNQEIVNVVQDGSGNTETETKV